MTTWFLFPYFPNPRRMSDSVVSFENVDYCCYHDFFRNIKYSVYRCLENDVIGHSSIQISWITLFVEQSVSCLMFRHFYVSSMCNLCSVSMGSFSSIKSVFEWYYCIKNLFCQNWSVNMMSICLNYKGWFPLNANER